jgi:hypothetical protein
LILKILGLEDIAFQIHGQLNNEITFINSL